MKKIILFLFAIVFTTTAFSQKSVLSDGNAINNPVFKKAQNESTNQIATNGVSEYYASQQGIQTPEMEAEILADAKWRATHAANSSPGSSNAGTRLLDLIPTAGATETFTPAVGDNFFDPGGPGGSTTGGTSGNYPNCGCDTFTTLAGVSEIDFLYYSINNTFDYLIIYDGLDTTAPVIFDSVPGDIDDLAELMAANGGSSLFTSSSGNMTFEFHASSVVDYGGWDAEITAISGGGGGTGTACEETNPSNAFEGGRGCSAANSWMVATDITVAVLEDFSLEQISANLFLTPGATFTSVDVLYFADNGGLPGTQIGSELGIVPTSQTVLGSNFGLDIAEVVLDVTAFDFAGQTGSTTTYWIGLITTDSVGGANYWEYTSASVVGNTYRFSADGGTTWDNTPVQDTVYTFSGECTTIDITIPPTPTCTHQLELSDPGWGDGWNGGTISVFVNGDVVLNNVTNAAYVGPEYFDFEASEGDEITTDYTPGTWSYENLYKIFDVNGNLLFESGYPSGTPVDLVSPGVDADCSVGEPPIISCPVDAVADSDPGVCGAVVNFADASAIDPEDGPLATTLTWGDPSGSVFPIGDTYVGFSATDSDGNTTSCYFLITVTDVEAPMAMCQDITVELDAAGMASITAADVDAGSSDNCSGFTMALDITTFDCSNVGENTVTLTVTDASYGTDTCTAIVTVEDNQAPEIICHGGGGDNTLTTAFTGTTTGPNGMMFDVMAISTLTVNSFDVNLDATGVIVDVYAKSGTWVGSENNSAAWTLIGSVSGMSGTSGTPTPLNLTLGYEIPAGELHAFYVVPQTGNFTYTPGTAVGNLLATDGNLELYEGCAKRLPIDGGPLWEPRNFDGSIIYGMSTLPPFEVVLDPDGNATVDAGDLLLSVDDNCGTIATFGSGAGAPGSLTTTFAGGNGFFGNMFDIMALNALTVDSFDVHLASGTSDDVEVYFKTGTYVGSETNPADWTLLDTALSITSAGDGVPTPLNLNLGHAVAAGETVAFYVTIVNAGTMSYTNGTTTGALFASDDNMEFYEGAGGGYFDVSFNPRVFNGNILYSTGGGTTMDFDCADLGENMVDITVTDAGGNEAMCTATVLVLDETAPILVCEDQDIELGPDGTTTIDPYDLMAVLPSTYEVMVIGSDNASGTEGFTDFTVAITDAASLSFDWDYTLNDIPGYDSFGYLLNGVYTELTDPLVGNQSGTGTLAVVAGDEFGFRSYTTDNSFGNNETLITNFMPGFSGQFAPANWNLTLLNSDGNAYITEIPGGIQAYDACGIDVIIADVTEVSCADIGTPILVTVFANDASGNFTSCQATINVVDNLEPELTCPDPSVYGTEPSNNDGVFIVRDYLDIAAVSFSDNCTDTANLIYTQTPAPGTQWGINGSGNPGPYEVVFTVEDEYGNIATCTLEVIVINGIGVTENTLLDNALALYPNPATDQVTLVNTSEIALQTAMIYDLNDKLVADIDLRNMQNETSFDVSDFASGVYMVKVVGENANTVKRLIKK